MTVRSTKKLTITKRIIVIPQWIQRSPALKGWWLDCIFKDWWHDKDDSKINNKAFYYQKDDAHHQKDDGSIIVTNIAINKKIIVRSNWFWRFPSPKG